MKIPVNKIPPEGLRRHATYDPSALDMERFDVHLREPFEVEAFITVADRELVVDATARARLHLSCARCLGEFPRAVQTQALFTYTVKPTDTVDITDDVRQEIILTYPIIPLCQPTCRGLCSACGQDLNVASCQHAATEGQGR